MCVCERERVGSKMVCGKERPRQFDEVKPTSKCHWVADLCCCFLWAHAE